VPLVTFKSAKASPARRAAPGAGAATVAGVRRPLNLPSIVSRRPAKVAVAVPTPLTVLCCQR